MSPIALMPRKELLLLALFAFPCLSLAQTAPDFSQASAAADAQLNAAYKQALSKFTPANQEKLRRAERAWLAFSESEKILVSAIQRENLTAVGCDSAAIIGEVIIRGTHLRTFFAFNTVPTALPPLLQTQDEILTKTYAECMHQLNERDQNLLKKAERAWIAYRDADSASILAAYGNPMISTAAAANLTSTREGQLADIIRRMKEKQHSVAKSSIQESPPSVVQKDVLNPQDAEAITEFKRQAKALLMAVLANKDDSLLKKAYALKNVPELPTEVSEQVSSLLARYVELSRIPNAATPLNSVSSERAAIEILASWSKFTHLLKTGRVEEAGTNLQKALDHSPRGIPAEYLALWHMTENWLEIYQKDGPKFQEHIRKAKMFEDLGKSSDAIKEYQAAYDLIDIPSILEKIKKIPEQSLGL